MHDLPSEQGNGDKKGNGRGEVEVRRPEGVGTWLKIESGLLRMCDGIRSGRLSGRDIKVFQATELLTAERYITVA